MWHCPKCGAEVADAAAYCWVCGTSPDAVEWNPGEPAPQAKTPWSPKAELARGRRQVRDIWDGLDGDPARPAAGVTRRFGLDRLMLITTLFAATFALLRTLDATPAYYVVIVVFAIGVGLAQAILYAGKQPRKASIVAGAVLGPVFATVGVMVLVAHDAPSFAQAFLVVILLAVALALPAAAVGAASGYVVGCCVAATFLKRQTEGAQEEPPAEDEFDPLADVPPKTKPFP